MLRRQAACSQARPVSDKPHDPSPQRLKEARKQGQLARSKPLTNGCATLGGLVGLAVVGSTGAAPLRRLVTQLLIDTPAPTAAFTLALDAFARLTLPVFVGAVLGGAAAAIATTGLEVDFGRLTPKFERLNPLEGAQKLVGVKQWLETGRGLALGLVVLLVGASWLEDELVGLGAWLDATDGAVLEATLGRLRALALKLCALVLGLGLFDYALARRRLKKQLMMSHEEVKQEHKNSEGDPHHKSHRKSLHRQLANQGPARGAKTATAVVVNPTHIAVALRYVPDECDAPYIVAKGKDDAALAIRREAGAHAIPIVKDVPLARSLIHFDVGEAVPEELYRAAAAVLAVALEGQRTTPSQSFLTPGVSP